MFYPCRAFQNDVTGKSRPLTQKEVEAVLQEYPELKDDQARIVFAGQITSKDPKPLEPTTALPDRNCWPGYLILW